MAKKRSSKSAVARKKASSAGRQNLLGDICGLNEAAREQTARAVNSMLDIM